MSNLNPIVFINGDGGTGRVAPIVRQEIFGAFPTVDIPMTVDDRLDSNDECIDYAVEEILNLGTGFKNSTRSSDKRLVQRNMKSANTKMRPKLGVYAMLRLLNAPLKYDDICGVLRYGYGGIYNETDCDILIDEDSGDLVAFITQELNLSKLEPFARLAIDLAKQYDLNLRLSSKYTIAESEYLFKTHIEDVWTANRVEWEHHLTDIGLSILPVETAYGGSKPGGFLHVADNANGDTASDIVDHQNGGFVMGSQMYCLHNGKHFSYFELPGGTAEQMLTGELTGHNFLNPSSIIYALCGAFETVNPDQKEFFTGVRAKVVEYLESGEKDTLEMINFIGSSCQIKNKILT